MNVERRYQFGHVTVAISMPEEMPIPENMKQFECMDLSGNSKVSQEVDMHYTLLYMDCPETGQKTYSGLYDSFCEAFRREHPSAREIRRENMRILTADGLECRVLNFQGYAEPYAVSIEKDAKHTQVWVSTEISWLLTSDTVFVSLLSLEKRMLGAGSLILHSAYMCREGQAVLFSAPSETGKSTQADLWEKYRGTRTINGDRSLLVRDADGWYAYGWPVCGSSKICHNEKYPVQAIIMLHQAVENKTESLRGFSAVQKLMSQITINMWNTEFQLHAMDLIEQIAMEIPVYELGCNMTEDAVKCLENVLIQMRAGR